MDLSGLQLPEDMSASDRSELCRICSRRRGEHGGQRGTYCPDNNGHERTSTFIGTGTYGEESPDVLARIEEWEQRRLGRVPVYRRRYRTDKNTGGQSVDGFELADYVDARG